MQTAARIEEKLRGALRLRVIPGLDAMRAIAILLVVLFHMDMPSPGPLGVILFFVLSGFLITSLLLKELNTTGGLSLSRFYRNRAFRIFPAFYAAWFLYVGWMFSKHEVVLWKRAAGSFFYLADYGRAFIPLAEQGAGYPMSHSWSLAIEEQFYLLWPLILLALFRRRKPARLVAMLIVVIWIWRAVLTLLVHVPWSYTYNAFDTRADALFIGCWLALVVYARTIPSSLLSLLKNQGTALLAVAVLAGVAVVDVRASSLPVQVATITVEPVLAAIVLLQWIYWGANEWSALENPAVKWIARLSYSIYLFHPMAMDIVGWHNHLRGALTILAFACASYYLIERPFLRLRDRGRRPSVLLDDAEPPSQSQVPQTS